MDFKYIKNIDNGVGTILLYNQIGDSIDANGNYSYGISGTGFAYEMQYLQTQCSQINVRINSIGGSVLDGYSIISSILNSEIPVYTYIDGLAASIAGVIAVAGKKCYMMDYGTLMMHNPSGGSDNNVLALVKDTLVTILSNRTSKTAEEISTMMDKETWLSSSEALNMGLVDEVISSGKKIRVKKEDSLYNMAIIYNKLINTNNKQMEKVTNMLGLTNEANETEVVAAIEKKDETIKSLEAEKAELQSRLDAIEAKEKEAKEAALKDMQNKATLLIENAIKDKKVEETKKDEMISLAVSNYELVENMLSKVENKTKSVPLFDAKNVAKSDRENWSIRDWEKKDAKGLEKIKNENPELYIQMFNEYYKK